jgi:peptide/nickel transport system permease protein
VSFLLRRIAAAAALALVAATLVFVLLESAPGEPGDFLLGDRPLPPEVRERLEQAYGFDRPAPERYLRWLATLAHGQLGWSHSRSRPVAAAIGDALPNTLLLAAGALAVNLVAGLFFGVVCALRRGGALDRLVSAGTLTLYAMPTFWLGLMVVLAFAYGLGLFPASSMHSVGSEHWSWTRQLVDRLWHLVLPAGVLGLGSAALTLRLVRDGILQGMSEAWIRAARARGAGAGRVLVGHALRSAALPVINLVGVAAPALLSGSLVVEVVFAWPGMGRLAFDAIQAQDVPVVLATTLVATLAVALGSLAADLAMSALDPRIRLASRGPSG